jgi:uncharacterized protein YndB with AHSA1/START domain
MVPDKIERETVIDAPVQRVWELVTQAEHLGRWFAEAGVEIDLRPGGAMSLSFEGHGTSYARVEEVEPERVFAFRWPADEGHEGDELDAGNSTLVRFTLTPAGDATRLRVVESGFSTLDFSEAEQAKRAEGNREGWEIELGHLADYAQRVGV